MSTNTSAYDYEPEDKSIYLKIEPDTEVRLRLISDPVHFIDEYQGQKSDKWGWIVILKEIKDGKPHRTLKAFKAGSTIYKAIRNLAKNEEWGDPQDYDLTIKRTGSDKQTKYAVVPYPKKALTTEEEKLKAETDLTAAKAFEKQLAGTSTDVPDDDAYDPFGNDY